MPLRATGVDVTATDGQVKNYPAGRGLQTDGYGDLLILDANDKVIAKRGRGSFSECEVTYSDTPE